MKTKQYKKLKKELKRIRGTVNWIEEITDRLLGQLIDKEKAQIVKENAPYLSFSFRMQEIDITENQWIEFNDFTKNFTLSNPYLTVAKLHGLLEQWAINNDYFYETKKIKVEKKNRDPQMMFHFMLKKKNN